MYLTQLQAQDQGLHQVSDYKKKCTPKKQYENSELHKDRTHDDKSIDCSHSLITIFQGKALVLVEVTKRY